MNPKVSVQWAASMSSVFWGVWWTAFVRDLAASNVNAISILSFSVERRWVLVALVIWGILYAVIFVRWLARVQHWELETGLGLWIRHSRSLIFMIGVLCLILFTIPPVFNITGDIVAYGGAIAILWPVAPFLVAIWREDKR